MLVEGGDSRQQTEEEKRELRYKENLIIDAIISHDGTLKDKIQEWAQIIERRIELLDCNFLVSEISAYITRSLRQHGLPIASHVPDYLPDKYKNPDYSRFAKLAEHLQDMSIGSVQGSQQLEQCSNIQLESMIQYIDKAKNTNDDIGTLLNNRKEMVLQEAIRRGIREIAGEKIRDPISARDYRFEIPDDAELSELNTEVIKQGERVIHEYDVFIHEKYPAYPATLKEKARQYGNSFRVYANMMAIINEEKWSGDVDFWLDRNYWKKVQSSHKSGNSTMFPTTLCARCSKDIDENPKDFHVTKYDKTSPTGYRCDNCGSTEIDDRFTSREQVGDKGPEVDRMASDIVNHIEHYVDIFKDVRVNNMNPAIQARKRAISNEFRIASMGKEKIVVPRKKTK